MKLIVTAGDDAGKVIVVDRELTVGRLPDNNVHLDDTQVSSHHARLRPVEGGIEVTDLGSTNGTFIEDERISQPRVLLPGQRLRFGGTTLSIEEPAASPAGGTMVAPAGGTMIAPAGGTSIQPPAPTAPPVVVTVVGGPDAGRSARIDGDGAIVIGRATGDLVLAGDPSISSRHAEIRRSGREVTVTDFDSSNGTFVEGQRISAPTAIVPGTALRVGATELSITAGTPVAGSAAPRRAAAAAGGQAPAPAKAAGGSKKGLLIGGAVAAVVIVGGAIALFSRGGSSKDAASTTASTTATAPTGPLTPKQIVDANRDSTVFILAKLTTGLGSGSGSVVDAKEGLILTNNHVAGQNEGLTVRTDTMKKGVPARLVAAMPCEDLALVQITNPADRVGFKQVALGDSTVLSAGDPLVALGFPAAADNATDFISKLISATNGIVSKPETTLDAPGSDVAPLQSVIEHTAAINPGNSGGPLFNADGAQVGVNTAGGGGQSENYSITIARVKTLLDQLKQGYSPKWIGAELTPIADSSGKPIGLKVGALGAFGPADNAKLVPGWLIFRINRRPAATLTDYCANMPETPGTKVNIQLYDPSTQQFGTIKVTTGNPK
jgi:S1-C subfamily serine protease/pSer/pThr/pTyr-binding forkhead associated (FHA) protein